MTTSEYRKLSEGQMRARRWRTVEAITTGKMSIPAGVEVKVVRKFGGVDIQAPARPHCGVAVFVRKCRPAAIEEIIS